jgi:hypothetical protein
MTVAAKLLRAIDRPPLASMKNDPAPVPAPGKTLQNFLTLAQIACVAALMVWVFLLKRDLASAEERLAALRQRPAPAVNLQKENQVLRAKVADLESQLAAAAAVPVAPVKPTVATVATPPPPATQGVAIAALMNNPAMRTMMATTQRRVLETRFAELFTQLQLSPEQRARFIDLLSEGQAATTDAGLKLVTGNLSAMEQAALRQQLKDLSDGLDPKIREFLGDDAKFALYKQFTDQQTERSQLTRLNASLAQSGQPPLSTEQSAALTSIMYAERKSFSFTPSPSGDPANPMAVPSTEAMDTMVREQAQLQNRIADRAAAVLSPEQLASLRRDQAARLENLKTSAEMARQVLGGTAAAPKL